MDKTVTKYFIDNQDDTFYLVGISKTGKVISKLLKKDDWNIIEEIQNGDAVSYNPKNATISGQGNSQTQRFENAYALLAASFKYLIETNNEEIKAKMPVNKYSKFLTARDKACFDSDSLAKFKTTFEKYEGRYLDAVQEFLGKTYIDAMHNICKESLVDTKEPNSYSNALNRVQDDVTHLSEQIVYVLGNTDDIIRALTETKDSWYRLNTRGALVGHVSLFDNIDKMDKIAHEVIKTDRRVLSENTEKTVTKYFIDKDDESFYLACQVYEKNEGAKSGTPTQVLIRQYSKKDFAGVEKIQNGDEVHFDRREKMIKGLGNSQEQRYINIYALLTAKLNNFVNDKEDYSAKKINDYAKIMKDAEAKKDKGDISQKEYWEIHDSNRVVYIRAVEEALGRIYFDAMHKICKENVSKIDGKYYTLHQIANFDMLNIGVETEGAHGTSDYAIRKITDVDMVILDCSGKPVSAYVSLFDDIDQIYTAGMAMIEANRQETSLALGEKRIN